MDGRNIGVKEKVTLRCMNRRCMVVGRSLKLVVIVV